jgi:hypothetical protein
MNPDVCQHNLNTTPRDTMKYYNFDLSYKTKSTAVWLDSHQENYINDWPAQSPDLGSIEHVWHQLKVKLSYYERRVKNTDKLWERVEKIWNVFGGELCQRYTDNMPEKTQ